MAPRASTTWRLQSTDCGTTWLDIAEISPLAKGNDGNYLQHCVEVEAAVRLRQACPD